MGRLKALLPWQGSTLIEYQVESLLSAGVAEVVVVVGHRADEVGAPVRGRSGVTTVVNLDYKQGKTTSIKAGVRAISGPVRGVLLLAVDHSGGPLGDVRAHYQPCVPGARGPSDGVCIQPCP